MVSIYSLKGRFQNLLRPLVRGLHRLGVSANQVTLGALVLSVLVAAVIAWRAPWAPGWFALLPAWMLLRMAFNAIDGMLAREHGQQSRLGACLNELGDVLSDAALYLALLALAGVTAWLVWLLVWLAALTEFCGVLAQVIGAGRRYDGPMGKSDRAFVLGVLGLLLAVGLIDAGVIDSVLIAMSLLCAVTAWRRVASALRQPAVS